MIYGLTQFFNLFNIVFIGTSISIFVVSYFVYKPFDEDKYESDTDENEYYEYKYLEDYYDLLDKKLKLKEEETLLEGEEKEDEEKEDQEQESEEQESEEQEDEEQESEDTEPYEENEDLVSLKDNFIEENTPRGIIYMAYEIQLNHIFIIQKQKTYLINI